MSSERASSSGWLQVSRKLNKSKFLYAMLVLPISYFLVFHYAPMLGNLMAFQDFSIRKGLLGSPWAGFKYFEQFLFEPYFWKVVRNTLLLNLYSLIFYFPAPIIFAILVNELIGSKFKRVIQTVAYVPHFLSTVVVAGMLVNFLSVSGLINEIITWFGGSAQTFLSQADWFRTIFIGSEIWQGLGWSSIVYLAALTAIDPGLYEAATIDGANRWHKIRHITLPGISAVATIMLLLSIGQMLSVGFEKILLLYSGPTYETADVIQTYVYRRGLIDADLSFAAAVGIFQSVISLILIVSANQLSKKINGTRLF
ncbi:sugar ABC transporter permease [Paenibacillus sp. MY03]|jgi:putative aldouronate transport system permease protein|uniref:ABC transporter permease n=1 Tax=Paenibacillus sp. MY03 TaxID=302980 RepID=UPI000B3C11AC|nr:ABC transporter permease subunit [Paenibacillus sp. MY03]OUS76768.1 sugar ABC transporter permease [Paenibacillus sp. MY03]